MENKKLRGRVKCLEQGGCLEPLAEQREEILRKAVRIVEKERVGTAITFDDGINKILAKLKEME